MVYSYWRCDWTHDHADTPVVIFYEVDDRGDVPRIIDVFANGSGSAERLDDYSGREKDLCGIGSFVEGDFLELTKEMRAVGAAPAATDDGEATTLTRIDSTTFEEAWGRYRSG
ncbi:MAG: hypothetical protein Q7J28_15755 [Caulobacter sp.]|nr:hypothetical protein [Caulobacter sp.]